ncbi:hypothetical protein P689_119144 [Candidatus Riesia pediculischaeffi PTSU]|uniref:Uncharacterized protein n=1 Tax=Candidatus Riesia pediculischaeffi PTSU TaxID=1401651 RepID=A0A0C1V8K5_9ENTR|nr:hypothetical protein P689_119144 [Candidatus Riesia pediculischaeffi PTSU]
MNISGMRSFTKETFFTGSIDEMVYKIDITMSAMHLAQELF